MTSPRPYLVFSSHKPSVKVGLFVSGFQKSSSCRFSRHSARVDGRSIVRATRENERAIRAWMFPGRRFRRNAGTPFIAAVVGVVSGFYIFNEPLKRASEEVRQRKEDGSDR